MYHCIQTLYKITSERGQPLYKGQNAWSQSVLYLEVPLYCLRLSCETDLGTNVIIHSYRCIYNVGCTET